MGMRNPELPGSRRLLLNHTPPAGPVEPFESSFSQLPTVANYVRVSTSGPEYGTSLKVWLERCRSLLESDGYRTGGISSTGTCGPALIRNALSWRGSWPM